MERRDRPRLVDPGDAERLGARPGGLAARAGVRKLMGKDEATQKAGRLRRAQLPALAAPARRAGGAPALRPAHQRLRQDGREVVRREPGDRRGAPRRGALEVPARARWAPSTRSAPTLKILLDELLEAQGVQKKTLGMQTLFEGMAVGIMDLLRSDSRNPLLDRDDPARRAGRGAPRRLRRADDAPRGERREPRPSATRWRTGRSRSSRR